MPKKAVVLLAEGFEEIEAATPIDVLRRVGVEVLAVGLAGVEIRGSHGLIYRADVPLAGLKADFDLVVLPGGMPGAKHLGASAEVRELVECMLREGKLVGAICAAPVMTLGAWGHLKGKRATCFPGMEGMLPSDVAFQPDRVVADGNIVTSRGPGTALEFSLALAERLVGKEASIKVAKAMLAK